MVNYNTTNKWMAIFCLLFSFFTTTHAQLSMSAQIRPRGEVRDGLGTLKLKGAPTAGLISQRSRLNFNYKFEKIAIGLAIQDIRIWGQDASTISNADGNKLGVHEAWTEINLSDSFGLSLKLGRQELLYDD